MERKHFLLLFGALLLAALFLRLNAISTTEPWWDENLYTVRPYNFLESDHLSTIDQAPLYFYLADVAYKLMGLSVFSARFLSLFFGMLSTPLLYLVVREIASKEHALISSAFLAFSGFHIAYTIGDMGLSATFFILLFLYFFIKLLKTDENKYLLLCSLTAALGTLIKSYMLIFAFSCGMYFIYSLYRKGGLDASSFLKKFPLKYLISSLILFLFFISPILIYNLLLFQEKGQMDIIFTRFFRLDESAYAGLGMPEFDVSILPGNLANMVSNYFLHHDMAIFSLGVLGMLLVAYKREGEHTPLLLLCFLLPLFFLLCSTGLPKNFVFFAPLISFFAADAVVFLSSTLSRFVSFRHLLVLMVLLVLALNLYSILSNYESSFPTVQLRDEVSKYSPQNTLFIADSRIYRGKFTFALMDRHYAETLELKYVPFAKDEANSALTKTVFIECVPGDCGWGAGKVDAFLTAEEISSLKKNLVSVREIPYKEEPYYRIYSGFLSLEPYSLSGLDYVHSFYFYPVAWKEKRLSQDNYNTENSLHSLGKIAIYLSILLSTLLSFYSVFLFARFCKKEPAE